MSIISTENTEKKQRGKQFSKGVSGNPAGRPRGSLNVTTKAAIALLDGEAEEITRKAIELALEGNMQAIKLVMERVIPARKELTVELPIVIKADTIKNILDSSKNLINLATEGKITLSEAQTLISMLDQLRKNIETHMFEERIFQLEQAVNNVS
jgi:hypothetical protein